MQIMLLFAVYRRTRIFLHDEYDDDYYYDELMTYLYT